MGEWYPIAEWHDCQRLARPGVVFEIQNAEGKSLLTDCGPLPPAPFDWLQPAIRFRLVAEPPPRRSAPIPPPRQ
jgi:hypothetical protein